MENTQICSACKISKNNKSFAFRDIKKNLLQDKCKECKNSYNKIWYRKNKKVHKKHAIANKKKYYIINMTFVLNYLNKNPCIDCGESDLCCLDFDHVSGNKFHNVSVMIPTYCLRVLKKEIDKCEVRCANCHRRKTAKDQNWYAKILNVPVAQQIER